MYLCVFFLLLFSLSLFSLVFSICVRDSIELSYSDSIIVCMIWNRLMWCDFAIRNIFVDLFFILIHKRTHKRARARPLANSYLFTFHHLFMICTFSEKLLPDIEKHWLLWAHRNVDKLSENERTNERVSDWGKNIVSAFFLDVCHVININKCILIDFAEMKWMNGFFFSLTCRKFESMRMERECCAGEFVNVRLI